MQLFFFIFSKLRKLQSKEGFLHFNFYLYVFLISFSLIALILTDSFSQGYKNKIYSKIHSIDSDFLIKKYSDYLTYHDSNILNSD